MEVTVLQARYFKAECFSQGWVLDWKQENRLAVTDSTWHIFSINDEIYCSPEVHLLEASEKQWGVWVTWTKQQPVEMQHLSSCHQPQSLNKINWAPNSRLMRQSATSSIPSHSTGIHLISYFLRRKTRKTKNYCSIHESDFCTKHKSKI